MRRSASSSRRRRRPGCNRAYRNASTRLMESLKRFGNSTQSWPVCRREMALRAARSGRSHATCRFHVASSPYASRRRFSAETARQAVSLDTTLAPRSPTKASSLAHESFRGRRAALLRRGCLGIPPI
eukprot:6186613-Pleurochrysis_carterae.AAC.1